MLKPYFAVIMDSFHAAFASRILWVAFLAIWILLGCLSPIGFREDFTTSFRVRDFENGTRLKAMLASALVDPEVKGKAVARIAEATPDDLKRQLERVGQGDEVRIPLQQIADSLNMMLERDDWYDAVAWKGTNRLRERRELEERTRSELSASEQQRLGRLRIEAAVPGVFKSRSARSILLTYAGIDFPATLAIDQSQFTTLINQWVVPTIINWLLGFVVIFLGILVTASIVPDMLEPGSLHLLLSKPVSRTALLLAKFLGGCVFVFMCVTQLVVGLWLIAGLRLDVWNARVLWCIPVCVFLFAVFYSVSVVAGLRWRSAILAIGVTCMFGALCLTVGVIGGIFDNLVRGPARIRDIAHSGDAFVGATAGGGLVRYDASVNAWVDVFETDAFSGDRSLPPVAIPGGDFLVAQVRGGRFNPFGSGSLDLLLLSAENAWEPVPSLRLPTGTTWIHGAAPARMLAMNAGGLAMTSVEEIRRAAGEVATGKDATGEAVIEDGDGSPAASTSPDPVPDWIAKLAGMMGGATSGFRDILPPGVALAAPRRVAVSVDGAAIFVASAGRLYRLKASPGQVEAAWLVEAQVDLEGEASQPLVLACGDRDLLVARAKEPLRILDARTLEVIASIETDASLMPVQAIPLGGTNAFALLDGEANCRIVSETPQASGPAWSMSAALGPGEVETLAYAAESDNLILVHHVDQVDEYECDPEGATNGLIGTSVRSIRPTLSKWRMLDRYVMNPLRFVIPQTGELGETVAAIVSGETTASIDQGGASDEPQIIRYRILRPVVSCAIFITVMLTIGCVYFATRDF